jgi:methylated-DNA-[protein]-cysteine S-methyltransferase
MRKILDAECKIFWYIQTPIGELCAAENGTGLCDVFFVWVEGAAGDMGGTYSKEDLRAVSVGETLLLKEAAKQFAEYFGGKRKHFDLPLSYQGTPFQMRDWAALAAIPYGQTRSYKQIATELGNPGAARAVGMANNRNPISIIIPCHRVIGSSGVLVGYGGGITRKAYLLELEQTFLREA